MAKVKLKSSDNPTPKKLSVKRAYEIADSLRKESGLAGVGSPLSTLNKNSTPADSAKAYQSAFAKIDEAEKNRKEYIRIKSLADKASNKNKK